MLINLNELNNKAGIKSFISNNLPGRQGGRNLGEGLKPNRLQTLINQMGDRPNVPNVCVILTSAFANDFPVTNLSRYFEDICDYVILLRHGGNKDLHRVPATVCPSGEKELIYYLSLLYLLCFSLFRRHL